MNTDSRIPKDDAERLLSKLFIHKSNIEGCYRMAFETGRTDSEVLRLDLPTCAVTSVLKLLPCLEFVSRVR
jgi:hypothetical protein